MQRIESLHAKHRRNSDKYNQSIRQHPEENVFPGASWGYYAEEFCQ